MADMFIIKVTPDKLLSGANDITNEINRLESSWKKIGSIITNSKNYWEGDASNMHQKYYKEVQEQVDQILKRLKEHPADLLQMAGLYQEAEKSASAVANSLPMDVIV